VVHVSDHNSTTNRNAVGAHDAIYDRRTTVAEISSGAFTEDGLILCVTDRANAKFLLTIGGTPNGSTILDAGNGNTAILYADGSDLWVEWAGVSEANDAATNTPLFHALWDYANGRKTRMLNKRYKYSGSYSGTVVLVGEQAPTVNAARTALENGSILEGTTNFSGDYVFLVNVGVDHGSAAFPSTGADGFKASASPYNSGLLCVLHNVTGLGRSATDAFHGVLVEGYYQAWITNCVGAKNQFCGAIKSRNVQLDGFRGIDGQNILILKSDTGVAAGSLSYINASKITGEGSANTQHGLRILSDSASIESVNIDGVNIRDSDRCVTVESSNAISELNISNVNGKRIRTFGLVTSGSIFEANLTNINLAELESRAAQLLGGRRVTVSNFFGSMKSGSTAQAADFFIVEAGVAGFTGHNIELVENYGVGATKGTLLLNNARTQNKLSLIKANVAGNKPQYGFSSQALSGVSNILEPLIDLDRMRSIIKVSSTADVSIVDIDSILSAATTLPEGYVVTTIPISGFNFTFVNNANLRNRSGDVVLTVNKTLSYMWGGASWHQLD
jgi:hypothetical protein